MLQLLSRERLSWVLSLFYFLTFGGFVAFSIYLPVLLKDQFGLKPSDAGLRTAGFVVLATLARPLGGRLADKIGGARVLQVVFLGIIPLALLMAWTSMFPFTVGALGCAFLLGNGNGAVFKLVPQHFPKQVGTVTGLVGAMGGLGGFFPPLLLGFFRDHLHIIWPRSVLCLPIVKQTKLIGALYLENNLTPCAFTSGRVAVLEMLASQAAISLENASLYSDLQRSEAFLAEGQSISHTGSFGWNVSSGEYWSEETYKIFEYDRAVKPTLELVFRRIHPDDRDRVQQTIGRAAEARANLDFEHRLLMPDGSVKHLHVLARALETSSGALEYVGTVMDVTERKRADEERERLRQVQADLAHLSRVTTMSELTASLAHEIRQPISAALTNAKTCLRWLGRDAPDLAEAREAASRIVNDATRAANIISRISLLFKKGAPQREMVDVNELIREMIALLRSEANRYSISIRTELAEGLPKVMADRVQLQQVFMNLMLNGIDAMKETTDGGELTIKSEAGDGQLMISVSDTGVGLPPEQADQIFRAFFTTKDNGTGMGLPISRSIIESHGGRLWAAGASGRGATFQFTLPATVAAHA
jgi:PAS domain S-box-containing protein